MKGHHDGYNNYEYRNNYITERSRMEYDIGYLEGDMKYLREVMRFECE